MEQEHQSQKYSTIEEDGVNYKEIAEIMSECGMPMKHSSARNYVIWTIKKFVFAIGKYYDLNFTDDQAYTIAKNPDFQEGISDLIRTVLKIKKQQGKKNEN